MAMARAAAARAMRDWAVEEAKAKPAGAEIGPPAKTPDPGLLFTRLAGAVRQAIALEARLAAGPQAPKRGASHPPPDPRRPILRQVLTDITQPLADHTRIKRESLEHLEAELAADTKGDTAIGEIFESICEALGIDIPWNKLNDEMLVALYPESAVEQHGADPPE